MAEGGKVKLTDGTNTYTVGVQAPDSALPGNLMWTLPTTAGTDGDVLMRGTGDTLEWGAGGGSSLAIGTFVDDGTARSVLFLDDTGALSEKNNTPSGSLTYTTSCVLKATTFGEEGSIVFPAQYSSHNAQRLAGGEGRKIN